MAMSRPTFVFDGDCGICRTWVDYWRQLTGERGRLSPLPGGGGRFPGYPRRRLQARGTAHRAGRAGLSGAAATFRLLELRARRAAAWWWLYRHVPGFARLSEVGLPLPLPAPRTARRRDAPLWGRTLEPERYDLVAWLFLRGLGLIYLAAFVSLALQIRGLVGRDGILPLGEYLAAAHAGWGTDAYWRLPTLFWLNASDAALMAGAVAGIALEPARHARHRRSASRSSACSRSTCRSSTPGSCS